MPNTLAHIVINGLLTRPFIRPADLILIYFGALIPDIPWIFQRIVPALFSNIDVYDLRLYCVVLASLFFSAILSLAIASIFSDTKRVFIIFSMGSLLHLLLDSLETKWANGVHLFAPFSWELYNAGFFWPENIFNYLLTALGFLYLIWNWEKTLNPVLHFSLSRSKLMLSIFFVIIYLILPFLFMNNAEEANNHFVKTLREYDHRPGKYFEIDRGKYVDNSKGDRYLTSFNEELKVVDLNLSESDIMSIRGKFISKDEIQILEYHVHSNRDLFTYVALLIIFLLSVKIFVNKFRFKYQRA